MNGIQEVRGSIPLASISGNVFRLVTVVVSNRSLPQDERSVAVMKSTSWTVAGIAQLVEHNLAKVGVAGSSPVSRSAQVALIAVRSRRNGRHAPAHVAGWSSLVARRAHNPEVVGSNPTPAMATESRKGGRAERPLRRREASPAWSHSSAQPPFRFSICRAVSSVG